MYETHRREDKCERNHRKRGVLVWERNPVVRSSLEINPVGHLLNDVCLVKIFMVVIGLSAALAAWSQIKSYSRGQPNEPDTQRRHPCGVQRRACDWPTEFSGWC